MESPSPPFTLTHTLMGSGKVVMRPHQPNSGCFEIRNLEAFERMRLINQQVNPWIGPAFAPDAFGSVALKPFVRVEVTNPMDKSPPPGSAIGGRYTFTEVTATVFVALPTAPGTPARAVSQGRGRLTVGPYFR